MNESVTKERIPASETETAYYTQIGAAHYLGVSVRWFRSNVGVRAVPMGLPRPGKKVLLRYRRADLDAWVDRCASYRLKLTKGAA